MRGSVKSIYIADGAHSEMKSLVSAEFVAGKGIVGDRYFIGKGEFSPAIQDADHEVTLIEAEQVEFFNTETSASFSAGAFRRNIVTWGVALNALVGQEF